MSDETMTIAALERALLETSPQIEWPQHRPMAAAVRSRIGERGPAPVRARWSRSAAVLVTLIVLASVASAVLVFSPTAREAVADWLGVSGVRVEFDDEVPRLGASLMLGRETDEAGADRAASFEVLEPQAEGLGSPEYYVDERIPGALVSLVYEASDEFPPAPGTRVGLLVSEFQGQIHEDFYKKVVLEGTNVRRVVVNGVEGLWLGGDPHFIYRDMHGGAHEEIFRMAGNTLLWEDDGVTYRIESALGEAESIRIAESFR